MSGGGDDYVTPHVALIRDTDVVKYQIYEPDYTNDYLTIEALEDGLTVSLSQNACEYCIDNGSWNNLSADVITPSINKGQTLSFKGSLTPNSGTGKSSRAIDPGIGLGIGRFTISKKCNLKGNIMSLLFGDNFEGQTDLNGYDYAFCNLFNYCSTIIDASQLLLPATTLASHCYYNMFWGCSSLVTVPELPATTLADFCYYSMFRGCSSLVTAPELPATTLAEGCYISMFENCSKLNYIKALFTTTPGYSYTSYWVSDVSSTGTFVKNKNAIWNVTGTDGIPTGWTVETF